MSTTTPLRERYAQLSPRARVRLGALLFAVGVGVTVLYIFFDGPVAAWFLGLTCVTFGASMMGTELRRRGEEQDRQARERRIAEQRRPWPGSEGHQGEQRR